jgi:hypothetical protein
MSKENKSILSVAIVTLIVVVIFGISYAYFTANLTGGETASTLRVSSGVMNITFSGKDLITITDIYPRSEAWATKEFNILGNNTTETTMSYQLSLVVEQNTFSDNALSYTLTGSNPDEVGTIVPDIADTKLATGESTNILGTGSFTNASNVSHYYVLKIFFLDTNTSQNIDQEKSFAAYIGIETVQ